MHDVGFFLLPVLMELMHLTGFDGAPQWQKCTTTSYFYYITPSHCQLAGNRLGDYFPLPSLPPCHHLLFLTESCEIFPPLSPSFTDSVHTYVYHAKSHFRFVSQSVPTEDASSEYHQATAFDLCSRHHWTCKHLS